MGRVSARIDLEAINSKITMPIIDVSQNSYRALVKAAHKRGMSVDRFIQFSFASETGSSGPKLASVDGVDERSSAPATIQSAGRPPLKAITERTKPDSASAKTDAHFEALWRRIKENAGDEISTKRGQNFTYEIDAGYLTVRDSGARIPRSQFKKALSQWPQNGPSTMRGIYAASVVWAVLADERIMDDAA